MSDVREPAQFDRSTRFVQKDDATSERRLVYGIVLEPETVDSQGDIYSAAEIEQAAHRFMADYQNVGHMHKALVNDGAEVVESYIAPADIEIGGQAVKAGTWILVIHVTNDTLWEQIKSGELTGLSIGGYAERNPIAATTKRKTVADYNNEDVKFVQMMIPHHQSAVDAAAVVYQKGENAEIKAMAKKIWNAQEAEIETLRKWLKARGITEKPPSM